MWNPEARILSFSERLFPKCELQFRNDLAGGGDTTGYLTEVVLRNCNAKRI